MGTFDRITIDLPTFPHPGVLFQVYINLADSYGDLYRVDERGVLWRLTVSAGMSDDPKYLLPVPVALDYTDPVLEAHTDEHALLLTFVGGVLTSWRQHPHFLPSEPQATRQAGVVRRPDNEEVR
jgi:hypothetical protein